MYTRCPHCLTVFVVAAEQLKAAHGNVRCGTCLESFDAIPHLSDGPAQAPPEIPMEDGGLDVGVDADESADAGDTRTPSEQLTSTLDAARAAAATDKDAPRAPVPAAGLQGDVAALGGDADGSAPDVPPEQSSAAAPGQAHHGNGDRGNGDTGNGDTGNGDTGNGDTGNGDTGNGDTGNGDTGRRVSVLEDSGPEIEALLPDVLRQDADEFAARSAARRRSIGYGIAGLALLVLLAGQYVFFMPEDATRRYPQWRGAIESLCVQIGCVLPERRDPARIRVVSRSVRVHPSLEGVMQIKATLTNAAPYRQPYPQVRFTLFNVNGQTIATREFQPSEYLGRRVAASARLRPQTSFQVELDVLAPEQAAVSFEFQFL